MAGQFSEPRALEEVLHFNFHLDREHHEAPGGAGKAGTGEVQQLGQGHAATLPGLLGRPDLQALSRPGFTSEQFHAQQSVPRCNPVTKQ